MVARKVSTKAKPASSMRGGAVGPRVSDVAGRLSSHRSLLGGFSAEDLAPYLDAPEAEGPIDTRKRVPRSDADLKAGK